MVSEAHAQARARAEAVLEAARRTLALPRVQGDPWPLPERDEPPRAAPPPEPARCAPSAGAAPVRRATLDRTLDAIAEEVGGRIAAERAAAALRFAEAERRLAELEAAVARLTAGTRGEGGSSDG